MSNIETRKYRRQSLSLNDLDHVLKKHDLIRLGKKHDIVRLDARHPSSSELSFDSNWFPAHPHEPAQPPPVRVKTPPGLPSFGSRQATLLRLPQHRSSRTSLRLRNWLHSHDESNEHTIASASTSSMASPQLRPVYSPPLLPTTPPNGPTESREVLRRTLAAIGMSRMLDPDPAERASALPPRSSLPASSSSSRTNLPSWIYRANVPGALARADDGSYIRGGAFGPRGSGHGIGARSIDALPLARLTKRAPGAAPAPLPVTLAELRRTEAISGRRSISAIGPAEQERRGRASRPQQEAESEADCCDVCCEKFCQSFCGIPAAK